MAQRRIAPVVDKHDKQRTYRQQLGRHSRAMREEFYFEALLIDYAILEDRLRSVIYHMGLLANRRSVGIWKKTRPYLLEVVQQYKNEDENDKLGLSNISGKMKIVRSVMRWAAESSTSEDDKYQKILRSQCRKLDLDECIKTLANISNWCDYRNEIVHALMNKNIDSVDAELKNHAEEGLQLARFLDSQERILKQGNKIRKMMNLPLD